MSKYTTEVRFICENYSGLMESGEYPAVKDIIAKSREKIFSFDYPIFDEDYKSLLETKILRHYYTREIGLEVVGLWKLKLETKMNEVMPYFNQLYESELIKFDPLTNSSIERTHNQDVTGTKTGTYDSNSSQTSTTSSKDDYTGKNTNMFSETPQGSIKNLEDGTYLTNATINNIDSETTGNSSNTTDTSSDGNTLDKTTNITEYLEHMSGKVGDASYSKMLLEYRKTFMNIDMQVIESLSGLFMNIW